MAHVSQGVALREAETGSGTVEGSGAIKLRNSKCYSLLDGGA